MGMDWDPLGKVIEGLVIAVTVSGPTFCLHANDSICSVTSLGTWGSRHKDWPRPWEPRSPQHAMINAGYWYPHPGEGITRRRAAVCNSPFLAGGGGGRSLVNGHWLLLPIKEPVADAQ